MNLVPESINEMSIKYLPGRTKEEIWDKLTPSEKKRFEARTHKQSQRTFPRGYKQMRVLDFIAKAGEKGVTRNEIARLYYEMSYGPESYTYNNRGYNSVNIQLYIYPYVKGKTMYKKLPNSHWWYKYHAIKSSNPQTRYVINVEGLRKLAELHNKFKNIKIEPEPYI